MKKYSSNILSTLMLGAGLGLGLTSCDDFLNLSPMNEVVKENYWTEKSDVESVVNSCYAGLANADCTNRMMMWGELRSDNTVYTSSSAFDVQQILKENILQTNPWTRWQQFYQVINRCNTVLAEAPGVSEKDPNFSPSELRATIAEVTAIRTLCYFYLVRTFRDVPYVTSPSADDANVDEHYRIAVTPMADVLANITADLEAVQNDAIKVYAENKNSTQLNTKNSSRVTRCFIYALLADLYLWQQNYDKCIEYCDKVIDYKRERYEELRETNEYVYETLQLYADKYPLIYDLTSSREYAGLSANTIFCEKNSFESIFELYYPMSTSGLQNTMVRDVFGYADRSGAIGAADMLATSIDGGNNEAFPQSIDYRYYTSMKYDKSGNSVYHELRKYASSDISIKIDKSSRKPTDDKHHTLRVNGENANWIIYRLTDVMLMKAEAMVEKVSEGTAAEAELADAFELVKVVNDRAIGMRASGDTNSEQLQYDKYASVGKMRDLVFEERRRELLFEGKRYYDLVRHALRFGDNNSFIEKVIKKHKENEQAIKLKLQVQDALFWPYNEEELKANPNLKQNNAYILDESSKK